MDLAGGLVGAFTGSSSRSGGLFGGTLDSLIAGLLIIIFAYLIWKLVNFIYNKFHNASIEG